MASLPYPVASLPYPVRSIRWPHCSVKTVTSVGGVCAITSATVQWVGLTVLFILIPQLTLRSVIGFVALFSFRSW